MYVMLNRAVRIYVIGFNNIFANFTLADSIQSMLN